MEGRIPLRQSAGLGLSIASLGLYELSQLVREHCADAGGLLRGYGSRRLKEALVDRQCNEPDPECDPSARAVCHRCRGTSLRLDPKGCKFKGGATVGFPAVALRLLSATAPRNAHRHHDRRCRGDHNGQRDD